MCLLYKKNEHFLQYFLCYPLILSFFPLQFSYTFSKKVVFTNLVKLMNIILK